MTTTIERKTPEKMLLKELRAELDEAKIEYAKGAKKPELVDLVRVHRDEGSSEMGDVAEDAERRALAEVEEEGGKTTVVQNLPAVRAAEAMVARGEVTTQEVIEQRTKISDVMAAVMKEGVHYGEIPGISKPTLLKPGAEVLAVTFRLATSYRSERVFDGEHLTVISVAKLTHIPTGLVIAEGEGLCTTHEKKYAYRGEGRTCPVCSVQGTIKKSKFAPRENDYPGASSSDPPGWYCHAKVGGCGANFQANDDRITSQTGERVANPDLPDTWNTVLKMANKRALVAAILNGTAASDIFTQDVEDLGATAADSHETTTNGATEQPIQSGTVGGPRSWQEIGEAAAQYGDELGWREWLLDAAERLFNTREWTNLGDDQKRILGIKAAAAIVALREAHEPGLFPGPTRDEVQKAWAGVLNGEILAGPGWRFSPEEADLGVPSYYEAHGLPEPEPPAVEGTVEDDDASAATAAQDAAEDAVWHEPTPEEQAELDSIPFGDDDEPPGASPVSG